MTDRELLQKYVAESAEDSFAALVGRYAALAYATALRITCDRQLAEDATQAAFLALAQKPAAVMRTESLSAWIHATARNCALMLVRSRTRQQRHEEEVATMQPITAPRQVPGADWTEIRPKLDGALAELPEAQREAVILRYLCQLSPEAAAQQAGCSEQALAMRLHRGLDGLRNSLHPHRCDLTSAALGAMLLSNASTPAPAGLLATLPGACLKPAAAPAALASTKGAIIVSMSSKPLATLAWILAAGAGVACALALRGRNKPDKPEPTLRPYLPPPPAVIETPSAADPKRVGGAPRESLKALPSVPRIKLTGGPSEALIENSQVGADADHAAALSALNLARAEISQRMGTEGVDWALAVTQDPRLTPELARSARDPWINVLKDGWWVTVTAIKLAQPEQSILWEWKVSLDQRIEKKIEASLSRLTSNPQPKPLTRPSGDF